VVAHRSPPNCGCGASVLRHLEEQFKARLRGIDTAAVSAMKLYSEEERENHDQARWNRAGYSLPRFCALVVSAATSMSMARDEGRATIWLTNDRNDHRGALGEENTRWTMWIKQLRLTTTLAACRHPYVRPHGHTEN